MQIGFFGQFFLTQSNSIAMSPDGFPEGFEFMFLLRACHGFLAKQGSLEI
jgi:hypothetical protein